MIYGASDIDYPKKLKVYEDSADSCLFKIIWVLGPPELVGKDSLTLGTVCSPNMGGMGASVF